MTGFYKATAWLTAVLGFTLLLSSFATAQNVPPAVISGLSSVNAPGLAPYEVFIAVDACGDIYTMQNAVYPNIAGGQVTEIPAGGGTPQVVITAAGQTYYYVNMWIDPAKANLYVSEGANSIIQIPIKNCVLQTSSETMISINNLGAVSDYYYIGGIATDAAGDTFIGNNIFCCGASYQLMEETPGSAVGTALLPNLVNPITSIAIDAANNIFYTDTSGQVSELPYKGGGAYASAPISFGGTFKNAIGVVFDKAGDLYVTDAGAFNIYEIPYETSVLNPSDRFTVVNLTNLHDQSYGAGTDLEIAGPSVIDAAGNVYLIESLAPTNGDPQTSSIVEVTRGSALFGSSAVGVATSATLNVDFNAAVTTAAINVVTSPGVYASAAGGTCVAGSSYSAGDTCTVNVKFTPAVPGLGSGAVVLADANGAAISSATLSGIGLGAGLTIDPGEGVAIGSGFKTPAGIALDLAGDVFVADSTNNQILEVVPGNATPVVIGSGLSAPTGVAVDAAGNVYIADTGNDRIVEVPFIDGALSSSAQSTIVSGSTSIAGAPLSAPAGLSIDTGGNLYIADPGNNRVVCLPADGNFDTAGAFTLGSGFSKPLATTVTPSGTIYIADTGNGNLYSVPYADPAAPKTLVAAGYTEVTALATDAAGDLFVVDAGKTLISRIPTIGGTLVTGSALNITGTIVNPYGVAVDPAGNLYATDNANAAAYSVSRTSATQDFGNWNPNTTSNTLSFLLENSGNQPLTFASPFDAVTGDTAVFTSVTPSTSPCANGATVAVGADCVVEAEFTPTSFAHYSETLTFQSNAENATTSQATFTGTGFSTLSTTTTLAITSPTGNPYYGQPIQLAVTVTATNATPSGSVALLVDGLKTASAVLTNGATTFTLSSGLSGGSHTLQASYLGANTGLIAYSQSQSAVLTTTVTSVATITTVSAQTLYINPASQPAGTPPTLIATVSSTFKGIPGGTVTFLIDDPAGSPLTVSAPLLPVSSGAYQASYQYTPLAPAPGTTFDAVTVGASYSGDGNFSPSSLAAPVTFYVSPANSSIGITSSSYSLTASGTGSPTVSSAITFTATSYGGWSGYVGFHCLASSLPANAICSFTPGQLQVQFSTATASYPAFTTQLSVLVNNPPNSPAQSGILWWISGFFGIVFFFTRRRLVRSGVWNTTVAVLACLLCLGAADGLSGCGSGNSYVTPTGTSTITVVADSDNGSKACPVNQTTGQPDLTQFPCSEQTFSVKLTVQ
jgi:sugar lactone lactonase YvrE